MSVCCRRGSALLVPASVVLALCAASPSPARAEPAAAASTPSASQIEGKLAAPGARPATLFGFGAEALAAPIDEEAPAETATPLQRLERVADFHPETDRWTDRNNRIRLSPWVAGWFFSNNLKVEHDMAMGLRLAWEVPGFIGIRLDSGIVPWSHLDIHFPNPQKPSGLTDRRIPGIAANIALTLGIFNPELSTPAGPLAFWAGFGPEIWIFSYKQDNVAFSSSTVKYSSMDDFPRELNWGAQIFIEMDFKISDLLHAGLGFREHIFRAPQTKRGRFWTIDGTRADNGNTRGNPMLLATVQDIFVELSILF